VRKILDTTSSAQAFAGEFDAVGVVDEAVEDRVGVDCVTDNVVPRSPEGDPVPQQGVTSWILMIGKLDMKLSRTYSASLSNAETSDRTSS